LLFGARGIQTKALSGSGSTKLVSTDIESEGIESKAAVSAGIESKGIESEATVSEGIESGTATESTAANVSTGA
jgi:hypothetical protein